MFAVGIGVLAVVALLIAPEGGGAQHEGGYLEFTGPGSGFMEVADDPLLNPTDAITVEAWIYLYSYGGWGTDPDYTTPPLCPELIGKNWEQSYALALGCGGDVMESSINGIKYYDNVPTIPLNTWTHLAMTYNLATRRNFQNGQPVTEVDDQEGPIGDTPDPLRIGTDVSWDLSPDGRIDDVRIWNIARTQSEIAAGMSGVPSDATGLVAEWTFDGGSLVDSTSGLTGTLMGDVQVGFETSETPTPTPTDGFPGNTKPGDVNCDNSITLADVRYILREQAEVTLPTPIPTICEPGVVPEDADCDGDEDVFDILAILKHIASVTQLAATCP